MIERLQAAGQALAARIRLSPREQALLAGLAAILGVQLAVSSYERAAIAGDMAVAARGERAAAELFVATQRSAPFHRAVRRQADKVQDWSLSEPTPYIAWVRAEADLEQMARAAGIGDVRAIADRSSEPGTPIAPLRIVVEGDFAWRDFLTFLTRLAAAEPAVSVAGIEVEPPASRAELFLSGDDGPPATGRFRLTVHVPYRVPSS